MDNRTSNVQLKLRCDPPRRASRGAATLGLAAVSLLTAMGIGCHLVTGADDLHVAGGGTGASGTGGNRIGGSGTGGGACVPSACPGEDGECGVRTCNPDGSCGLDAEPAGTPCSDGADFVCDGAGRCVDPACLDGTWNGSETDVDCGGPSCPPCGHGKRCEEGGDCESTFCTDGVCCISACDNLLCEACSADKTGKADGACEPVLAGTDPDGECMEDLTTCTSGTCSGIAGSCEPMEAGTVCRPDAGACDRGPDSCDGTAAPCPADTWALEGTDPEGECGFSAVCDASHACASMHQWSKRFGSTQNDEGNGVAVDGVGNVVVTGTFRYTVDFGGGPLQSASNSNDIFLAKYDASGGHLWSKSFGGTGADRGRAVAVDGAGNVLVTGEFTGTADFGGGPLVASGNEIFLAKFDPDGGHVWSQHFGSASTGNFGYAVAVDGSGNVVVTGRFVNTVDFGGSPLVSAGSYDIFLAKYDATGAHLWSQRFGDASADSGYAVAVDGANNVVVTGYFQGAADFGGGPLVSAGAEDTFLAKYDAGGAHLWSKRLGGTLADYGRAVAIDGNGQLLVTGHFLGTANFGGNPVVSAGGYDVFLARYGASGDHLWSRRFGGASTEGGYAVAHDAAGNAVVTGDFTGTVDFGGGPLVAAGSSDIFLASYDAAGGHLWSKRFGAAGSTADRGNAVAIDGGGSVLVTGYVAGTADFGGGPLPGAGVGDIFLAKYGL